MNVLVTGGAGYIGSHTVKDLINSGHNVIVLDNLSNGHRQAVDRRARFIEGNSGDEKLVHEIFQSYKIESVLHFAANIEVAESVIDPQKYYRNNFVNTLKLLNVMCSDGVKKFVFSSTAAVYGNPQSTPIEERAELSPINPYGRSKMMVEMALSDFNRAYGLGYVILRYFNVAGASPDGSIGEDHHPESHLIPRILQAANDPLEKVRIFGTDYSTPDGTCIRDYIHVVDLARAHVLALEKLKLNQGEVFNLGSENGFSVRDVVAACEKVTGFELKVVEESRREGDPAVLVASSKKIRETLGWERKFPQLEMMIEHAWNWHRRRPQGYAGEALSDEALTKRHSCSTIKRAPRLKVM